MPRARSTRSISAPSAHSARPQAKPSPPGSSVTTRSWSLLPSKKSALTGSASLVWYGITRIHPEAGGSEANQTSRNLLLSEHAKASPIPVLEIEAFDVSKCSHGATAGPVDEDDLFYLQSRAIPRDVAEQMLVGGFFADVIDRVPNEQLRRRIIEAVLAKAGGAAPDPSFDDVLRA